jgi:hypothetical protein
VTLTEAVVAASSAAAVVPADAVTRGWSIADCETAAVATVLAGELAASLVVQ